MRRLRRVVALAALVVGVLLSPAVGNEGFESLRLREVEARGKAAAACAEHAADLGQRHLYVQAADEWRRARALRPDVAAYADGFDAAIHRAQLDETVGRDDLTTHHAACVTALAGAAEAYEAADMLEASDRLIGIAQTLFPGDDTRRRLGLVYYAPYAKWARPRQARLLDDGWEIVGGSWIDPDHVAELNAQHATWDDPWVVGDNVHEIRTTQPLRTALRVLAHVREYRRMFLQHFGGEWELVAPGGKLPVIVTGTQAELRERMKALTKAGDGSAYAAAFYLQSTRPLAPVFVTFEPAGAEGKATKIGFDALLWPLKHEIGHQIAFEYSKHAADRTRLVHDQFWCVEGVANFMPYYVLGEGGWRLTHPDKIPFTEHSYLKGAFSWCHENAGALVPIERFVTVRPDEFRTVAQYHQATTLAYFLLEGADRRYRQRFIGMLQTVHRAKESATTWREAFRGVDAKTLQAEFDAFVRGLDIEE